MVQEVRPTVWRRRTPSMVAWLRIARIAHKLDRAATEQLRRWDLTSAQFEVLVRVGAGEGITQQELADALLVTKGNVCQLLDRMQSGGLLVRRQEGRANRLFLTDSGRTRLIEAMRQHGALIESQFAALSPPELSHLVRLLRTVDHALPR